MILLRYKDVSFGTMDINDRRLFLNELIDQQPNEKILMNSKCPETMNTRFEGIDI